MISSFKIRPLAISNFYFNALKIENNKDLLWKPFDILQKMFYTPPSKRGWSKQHYKIKTHRPLVQPYAMHKLHPEKEWWKERKTKISKTFMGFPDVAKTFVYGNGVYAEQMDPITLSVVLDKCATEGIKDESLLKQFCIRAQKVCSRTFEPNLSYIFKSFSEINYFNLHFFVSYLARIDNRLHMFQLKDCANIIYAMTNNTFFHLNTFNKVCEHINLMCIHRDDLKVEDLVFVLSSLKTFQITPPHLLNNICECMYSKDISELSISFIAEALHSFALLKHLINKKSSNSNDLLWKLIREVKIKLNSYNSNNDSDSTRGNSFNFTSDSLNTTDLTFIIVAIAELGMISNSLVETMLNLVLKNRYKMKGSEACYCIYSFAKCEKKSSNLYSELSICARKDIDFLSFNDITRAAYGLLKMKNEQNFVMEILLPRIKKQLNELDLDSLVLLYESLSKYNCENNEIYNLAKNVLCFVKTKIEFAQPHHLAYLSRSFAYLRPEDSFLEFFFECCQNKLGEVSERYLGMFLMAAAYNTNYGPLNAKFLNWLEALVLHAKKTLLSPESNMTAVCISQMIISLAKTSEDFYSKHMDFLNLCCEHLCSNIHTLNAQSCVNLCLAFSKMKFTHEKLLDKLGYQLDMKRYDLREGELEKAAEAYDSFGNVIRKFKLEPKQKKEKEKWEKKVVQHLQM